MTSGLQNILRFTEYIASNGYTKKSFVNYWPKVLQLEFYFLWLSLMQLPVRMKTQQEQGTRQNCH